MRNTGSIPCRRLRRLLAVLCLVLCQSLLSSGNNHAGAAEPNWTPIPSCSLDFQSHLETPAGQHGFLVVGGDGHFRWSADGRRARFWGVNVSSTRLDVSNARIEEIVTGFARAGLNLVRLEAIDNRNCLLGSPDGPDSRHFNRHYLDRLDRWMDALRRHGLYYYVDLLDFRTFRPGDGVLNAARMDRGARPYALFDARLIALQKEYATNLLTRRNPYTGLRLVDDPALAMVELCNEHGFFLYPEKLEDLAEPYRGNLRHAWNQWLREKYGTRERMQVAWGLINGAGSLRADEDFTNDGVDLPYLVRGTPPADYNIQVRRGIGRVRDGVQFLSLVQADYFRAMKTHLHAIGLKVPVTAVVTNDAVPDLATVAQECDFTSENWYGEGISGDPRTPGLNYYGNRNSLRDDGAGGFAPFTAALKWNNKPVVVREWAVTWPNRYRCASVPEALAYASLQDYDAVLLFGYQTNQAPNGAQVDALNDFSVQSDPSVWGLTALAARAFLTAAIAPARQNVTLTYGPERRFDWPSGVGDLHRLAWSVRVGSRLATASQAGGLQPTGTGKDLQILRVLLNSLGSRGDHFSASSLTSGVWHSDTGQITRLTKEGRLEVRAPTLWMLAGELEPGRFYRFGGAQFSTPSQRGAVIALALDGLPLEKSQHLIVKMVTRAENTGETLLKAPPGYANAFVMQVPGCAPVITFGRYANQPTRFWLPAPSPPRVKAKGKPSVAQRAMTKQIAKKKAPVPLLCLWMVDGTWEMELDHGRVTLACDTPGINGLALGKGFTTSSETAVVAAQSGATGTATR